MLVFKILATTAAFSVAPTTTPLSLHAKSWPFGESPAGLSEYVGGDFDPVGFSEKFPLVWLREAELKHCRVAMLAVTGYIFADLIKLPGEVHQVTSLEAHDVAVKSGAMTQIFIWCGVFETFGFLAIKEMIYGDTDRKPGDFYFDPAMVKGADDPQMQMKELRNGRLAMLAFSGVITQAALTGKPFPYF